MSNLFASLNTASNAILVLQNAIGTTQNNVTNASTPGFAKQRQALEAARFDLPAGYNGGVRDGGLLDSRSRLAEQAVRTQREALGAASQQATTLSVMEGEFDISGNSGILRGMNRLFESFSDWSAKPGDTSARRSVLDSAKDLADSFQTTAGNLSEVSRNLDLDVAQTLEQINAWGAKIQTLNLQKQNGGADDAGLEAQTYAALEELSKLVNFSTLYQEDGTVSVLIGGQYPLVMGGGSQALQSSVSSAGGSGSFTAAMIRDANGNEITGAIQGGKLGGLLAARNGDLAALSGAGGELDRLAQAVSDRVNEILAAGGGAPLFVYDTGGGAGIANSLRVNPALGTAGLVAQETGPPAVSNGICLKLAALADSTGQRDKIDGLSFVEFYGSMASGVGRSLQEATGSVDLHTDLAAQATALRSGISGVSLDEEAVYLLELQRAYQANARMVTVVNDLTQEILNLVGA